MISTLFKNLLQLLNYGIYINANISWGGVGGGGGGVTWLELVPHVV